MRGGGLRVLAKLLQARGRPCGYHEYASREPTSFSGRIWKNCLSLPVYFKFDPGKINFTHFHIRKPIKMKILTLQYVAKRAQNFNIWQRGLSISISGKKRLIKQMQISPAEHIDERKAQWKLSTGELHHIFHNLMRVMSYSHSSI